jgi:uncharacterized protein YbaR (Trm112 family)
MTKTTNRKQAEMNNEQDMPEPNVPVDPRLLEMLVCPLTRGPLTYDRTRNELISPKAGVAYPIRNGIPIMLADEERSLES